MTSLQFKFFPDLQKELQETILSYIADSPFEGPREDYPRSTLTHTLPLVSKAFRNYASQDEPWFAAIQRQLLSEPFLWRPGLEKICRLGGRAIDSDGLTDEQLILLAKEASLVGTFKGLFRLVLRSHIRFTGPVFGMGSHLQLHVPYGLHFFEPRYRLLISEVMRGQPSEAIQNGHVNGDCFFIHAHMEPLAPTTPAAIVQVSRCHIFPDGRADVLLVPVAFVWLEKVWVRPNSGGLRYAQCLRMDYVASQDLTYIVNAPRFISAQDIMNLIFPHVGAIENNTSETSDESDGDSDRIL